MARPKGSKNRPKLTQVGPADAKPGHNSGKTMAQLSDDQTQALTRQHAAKRAKLVEAEKTAKANRMNFDRVIRSDLGEFGLANIKMLEQLETPEGEAKIRAEMERQMMVARWSGLPIGTQAALFDEDRRPIEERAHDSGKRAGMKGDNCAPPHAPGTPSYEPWIKGWHEGQAVLALGFKKGPVDPVLRPEGNEPAGPDAFDLASDAGGSVSSEEPDDGAAPASEERDAEPTWPDDEAIADRQSADAL